MQRIRMKMMELTISIWNVGVIFTTPFNLYREQWWVSKRVKRELIIWETIHFYERNKLHISWFMSPADTTSIFSLLLNAKMYKGILAALEMICSSIMWGYWHLELLNATTSGLNYCKHWLIKRHIILIQGDNK